MKDTMDVGARAAMLFRDGHNCAEAILMAAAECLGVENSMLPRAATPFGGGMARTQNVCGALTGGMIAIGIALGRDEPSGDRVRAYDVAASYIAWFSEYFGSTVCRDLSRTDFHDPEQSAAFRRAGGTHDTVCNPLVERAARYLYEAIEEARVHPS